MNVVMFSIVFLGLLSTVTCQSTGILYNRIGTLNPRIDDGSSPVIALLRPFVYFGNTYNQIYVNNNGHLTFAHAWSQFVPYMFPSHGTIDLIAPFWTDLDNRFNGEVTYQQYTSGVVLHQATQDINTYFPGVTFTASWVFVATWYEVAYFSNSGTHTTFQVVLISGGHYSFMLMNYGEMAPTSHIVQAGYDTINSTHHFTLPGSLTANAVSSSSPFLYSSNVNVPGCWAFQSDHGSRGCTYNGFPVQLGDSFWTDASCAQRCTCMSTGLSCSSQPCSFSQACRGAAFLFSCQTVARKTCTIAGDPHYYTFDGAVFHFQGTCTYVLSQQCGGQMPHYRVESKNENRGSTHVAWTRLVRIFVYGLEIQLVKDHRAEAMVNGSFVSAPASLSNGMVQIYQSGFSLAVSTTFGLVVTYDAYHYVTISVPYDYQNSTCGLCGNFNFQSGDDFRTRQGQQVSSDVVFADSWKAPGDPDLGCGVHCSGLDCASCTAAQTTLYSDPGHCGILQQSDGAFASCHQQLPPQAFVESCVYDLCVGGGYQPIMCQALNVYASQCQQQRARLGSWRRRGFCEVPCPANSHFEPQGSACPDTCSALNSSQGCPLPPQETCACDPGYVLSGQACVPLAQCGCTWEGQYYRSGQSVILDQDCGRRCSCSEGSMTCVAHECGPLESCVVEDGERGCRPTSYATCWTKGPRSYRTFDGLSYQYPGACQLTLARVMGGSHTHFTVTAEKIPTGEQSFQRILRFQAGETHVTVDLGGSGRVQVNGETVAVPYSTADRRLYMYYSSVDSLVIHTWFGVTVRADRLHLLRLTAPAVYNGSLGGLCGNLNGRRDDDFTTPVGVLVNDSQTFGDSWRDGSLSALCMERQVPPRIGPALPSSSNCSVLGVSSGPFASCQARLDPQERINQCWEDAAQSSDPQGVLCEALRDYTLLCQQNGIAVSNWRNATGCERSCPTNSHYKLCGSSCPSSCPSLSFPFPCTSPCQEACQCDDGFLLSGSRCVRPLDCGCLYEGRYRASDDRFWSGGQCQSRCFCNGTTGAVHCSPDACGPQESCRVVGGEYGCHPDPHGTCSASGDPHYLSFDGRVFDFQGSCRYVLASLCNASAGLHDFSVEARNEPWMGRPVSITAQVFVHVWGIWVHVEKDRRGVAEVNGVSSQLPVLINGGQVSVYTSGLRTFIETDFGLSVSYDGWTTVSISLPSNYSGKTCGLCGNFNRNPNDDFITRSGVEVVSPNDFGDSWHVDDNSTCTSGCGSNCPRCTNEGPARALCDPIIAANGPLSFCHQQVAPEAYFRDCVFDTCVSVGGEQVVMCRAIQAYVSACQSANVRIFPWRENTSCSLDCPANTHYELCGSDCGHTCASGIDSSCSQVCSEGCFCNPGYLRSGGRCVAVETCGCQYDGFYYNVGDSFRTPGCSQHCQCFGPNDLRCSAASCTPLQQCTVQAGRLSCWDSWSACTVWGDPHYVTFDGALAHFQGTCKYVVAQSNNGTGSTAFQVVAVNNHRGNERVSFVSDVDVYLSDGNQGSHIRIGANKIVKVNGRQASLPVPAGPLAQVSLQGSYVTVSSDDLQVQFDGRSTLLIRVAQNHHARLSGMCGNYNGNPADDKVLPNGTLAQNDDQFGDSWKDPRSHPGCGAFDVRGEGPGDGCPFTQQYSDLCAVITNSSGPFSACHLHADPQPYFISCVYDLCLYTPANGMLCSSVSAYEQTCSVLGVVVPDWRSDLLCAQLDPCEQLGCMEDEWCGEKDDVYGCFCNQDHQRPNNNTYDSTVSCVSSSGTMSLSRCQLFEAGFHPEVLHLRDPSCNATLTDGRLTFHFDNDEQLCGTVLQSNGTHFMYENIVYGEVEPDGDVISRRRSLNLPFSCVYPLSQSVSMSIGINPLESVVHRRLPAGLGQYQVRMRPFWDTGFRFPFSGQGPLSLELDQQLYIQVETLGMDARQVVTVLDTCWATPVNNPSHLVRWELISHECPSPNDDTVVLVQNGVSTSSSFSFKMFTFHNASTIYLHCHAHLCLLATGNCAAHCYPGYHGRSRRSAMLHDTSEISLGPLILSRTRRNQRVRAIRSAQGPVQLISIATVLVCLLVILSLT